MQLSAIAYNLKKYLKFTQKHAKSGARNLRAAHSFLKALLKHILCCFKFPDFNVQLN